MMNKRGQGFSMGTLLALIIAIVLLVLLVLALSGTFGNWEDIKSNFFGSKVNVQTIVNSCKIACETSSTFEYCSRVRDVYFDKKSPKQEKTCKMIEGPMYGLDVCSNLDCAVPPAPPATPPITTPPATGTPA